MYKNTASKLALIGTILGMLLGSHAGASEATSAAFMATTGKTSQPIGHYEFCQSHASECTVQSHAPARVRLTPQLWNELVAVNAEVNLSVTAATDEEIFGRPEVWAYPGQKGDCEDLVLLKRRDLIEKRLAGRRPAHHGGPPEERRGPRGADGHDRSGRPDPRQLAASGPRLDRHGLPVRKTAIGVQQRAMDGNRRCPHDFGRQSDALKSLRGEQRVADR